MSGIIPRFYTLPVRQAAASEAAGRDIFEDREFLEILIPGDKHTIVAREVTPEDKERFAEHYRAFEAKQQDSTIRGTRLSSLGFLSQSQIAELEYLRIFTAEQLVAVPDTAKQTIAGIGQNIVQKAADFLRAAEDNKFATQLAAERDRQAAEIEDLKRQLAEVAEAARVLQADAAKAQGQAPAGNRRAA